MSRSYKSLRIHIVLWDGFTSAHYTCTVYTLTALRSSGLSNATDNPEDRHPAIRPRFELVLHKLTALPLHHIAQPPVSLSLSRFQDRF
jgi:hypothetical protein